MTVDTTPRVDLQTGLTWGIKRSFIRYIATLPDGQYALGGAAYLGESSYFTFPEVECAGAPSVRRFSGTIRMGGHGGLLDLLIADPWVERSVSGVELTVVDPASWPAGNRRIVLARLVGRGTESDSATQVFDAHLAEPGVALFGDQYPVGTALDTVVIGAQLNSAVVSTVRPLP